MYKRQDREFGAAEACDFVRAVDFPSSEIAFDAQFDQQEEEAPPAPPEETGKEEAPAQE